MCRTFNVKNLQIASLKNEPFYFNCAVFLCNDGICLILSICHGKSLATRFCVSEANTFVGFTDVARSDGRNE